MRIIGEIPHPVMKITVFAMNMRYSIKLEMGTLEQTYKLRESDYINGFEDIYKIVDDTFLGNCMRRFKEMNEDLIGIFERNITK